jgi:CO/xanthine dehydrogenase Mo-binding subunit
MAYNLLGKDFTPPDVRAKVTGQARYAEDFRRDGMAFVKLLLSPMPHAKVTSIDASEALAMEGVLGVLLPEEVPQFPRPAAPILTMEPNYVGEPILAIAAVDETTAADAIDRVKVTYEPLPFVIDALTSLYPGGPDVHEGGNVANGFGAPMQQIKWTARDFAEAGEGQLPMGQPSAEWAYGDLEAGFANAAVVYDETFVTASNSHHSMEPRSAFAYWENGKCYLHGSSQSQSFMLPGLLPLVGVAPDQLVYIAEFCGGGFGSKGAAYPTMVIPAHMAKKIGRPCMLRVSRAEEFYLGSARGEFQGRLRVGFSQAGRITAADLYIVQASGANDPFPDFTAAADALSLVYTPEAMRFRGVPVMTNTVPCGPQRGPGENQIACAIEPLLDKAARELGIDRVAIRELNAPTAESLVSGSRTPLTSAYLREALAIGRERYGWDAKAARSGERNGSKVIGVGVGQAYHPAGAAGFDGLLVITPDGKLHVHTGIGNLGTYSYASTSRIAAEVLGVAWENVEIVRGDSSKGLAWTLGQFGSNSTFTNSRAVWAAAQDAKLKLQEIAAMDLGGAPADYETSGERVFRTADPTVGLTFAQAAQRAIELGGKYDGHEAPADIMPLVTGPAVAVVAGTGLVGVAKDNLPPPDHIPAIAIGFMTIELDTETGKFEILDYLGVADCGTVLHPMGLATQIRGGGVQGIGLAALERTVYDPQNGLPANIGIYQAKPPSYLDVPATMDAAWVDQPDDHSPVGAKGIGEPLQGCAAAALVCAISDALGGRQFNRTPIVPDMIINAVAGRPQSHGPLAVKTQ